VSCEAFFNCLESIDSNKITAISTVVYTAFTIILVIITFYQAKIQIWIMRPKLKAFIYFSPPDCQRTTIYNQNAYYFRLRISNHGKSKAEQVEVFIEDFLEKQLDGSFSRLTKFLPQNLKWSHIDKAFYPVISPGMEKNCDLGFIIKPKSKEENNSQLNTISDIQFNFAVDVTTSTMDYIIKPNEYKIKIKLSAANAKPKDFILNMILSDQWYDTENEMLTKGLKISISH
jgi:hypothetical protein